MQPVKCPKCQQEFGPDEKFCGNDGTPRPITREKAPIVPPLAETATGRRNSRSGNYTAQISRNQPGCIIFLIDQSGSMEEEIAGGNGEQKKVLVADALNRALEGIVMECVRGSEPKPRDYFHIGIWKYSGDNEVVSAFDCDLITVSQMANRVTGMDRGIPVRFAAAASGQTPMAEAFRTAYRAASKWVTQNPNSFPPIVINLTDGVYSGQNPTRAADQLMQLSTSDGNLLLLNCHITQRGTVTAFPNDSEAVGLTGFAAELFQMSSPLQDRIIELASSIERSISPGARGYMYNANVDAMMDFFEIGTRVCRTAKG